MNILSLLVVILANVSIIVGLSTTIGIQYDKLNLFGTLVYAQPSTNNVTTLPPVELESVEPNASDVGTTAIDNSTEYLPYEDSDIGFKIDYPSDWTIDKDNSQFYTVIGFDSPDNDVNVDIRIFPKGDYKSIKEYGDKNFKESEDQTLLEYYRNSSTLLSGKPAFRAVYLTTYNPNLIENAFGYKSSTSKAMFTATIVPEKKSIYAIAYFAQSPDFDKYLPAVEHMINSFQVFAKGPTIQEDENDDNSTLTSKIATDSNSSDTNYTNSQQNLTSTEVKNSKLAEIVLLSQKLKKDSSGYRGLIGQIKNIGNDTALVVVIRLSVYDTDGNVIGSGYNFADMDTLKPGQKSTFTIMSDSSNFEGMKYYEIALEWSNMDNSKGYVDNAKIYKENNTKSID